MRVINKVSDVVRELVENAIDSSANSIQVHLTNFGLDRIEVRDSGCGINRSELCNAVSGGYTSKLVDTTHLSSQNFYGFRGEALSSICSVSSVWITTKTVEDATAIKFELDKNARILSEASAAYGQGTIVVADNLFEKFPVRRRWAQDKNRSKEELKEIETFLKSVALANPQTHIRLYHNSSLLWNKASVSSIEQALITVLGFTISKNLGKAGPSRIEIPNDDDKQRIIEAFFLKKPIDMKSMSFTGKKMTFIFVNKKRVFIQEFEKIVMRYTVAAVEKPAPADHRRYPVAVVNITVPADEVDYNLDLDKSKVLMAYQDIILKKLEELLQIFYNVTSLDLPKTVTEAISSDVVENDRQSSIQTFIENIPTLSHSNFSQQASALPNLNNLDRVTSPSLTAQQCKSPSISNFAFNLDDMLTDTPPDDGVQIVQVVRNDQPVINLDELPELADNNSTLNNSQKENNRAVQQKAVIDINQWRHGRINDSNGNIIQNIHHRQPLTGTKSQQNLSSTSKPSSSLSAFDRIGSGFQTTPSHKRPRLSQPRSKTSYSQWSQPQLSGFSLSGTARQVTINAYEKWDDRTTPKRKSSTSSSHVLFSGPSLLDCSAVAPSASQPTNNQKRKSIVDGVWDKYGTQQLSLSSRMNMQVDNDNYGEIVGILSDVNLYTAKINNYIGVFHPMHMLKEFASLKFELNVELEKISQPGMELNAKYVVSKSSVPKLFNEFINRVDSECNKYPKIFHKLQCLTNIQGKWNKSSSSVESQNQSVYH